MWGGRRRRAWLLLAGVLVGGTLGYLAGAALAYVLFWLL
jgi:hypothetical protein